MEGLEYQIVDKSADILKAVVSLDKKAFKKGELWGDLFPLEIAKLNTHLLLCTKTIAPLQVAADDEVPEPGDPVLGTANGIYEKTQQPSRKKGERTSQNADNKHSATKRKEDKPWNQSEPQSVFQTYGPQDGRSAASATSEVLGFCVFATNSLVVAINKIAVHPDHRRQGVGKELLRASLHWAITKRRPHVATLHVDVTNSAAIALYTSAGFARGQVLDDYYGPNRNAYAMKVDTQELQGTKLARFLTPS